MNSYLICEDECHAEFIDHLIMARLADIDGSKGSQWSGVYTNGASYGVLWASPASALFGVPITEDPIDGDPSVVIESEIINEEGVSNWHPYIPPASEGDEEDAI